MAHHQLVAAEHFDLTTCQEVLVDHGFTVPMAIRAVPVCINTVQHPLPSPARCYKLGQAIGRVIDSSPRDLKVVILGTGGMSHQLDGERAGYINKRRSARR